MTFPHQSDVRKLEEISHFDIIGATVTLKTVHHRNLVLRGLRGTLNCAPIMLKLREKREPLKVGFGKIAARIISNAATC